MQKMVDAFQLGEHVDADSFASTSKSPRLNRPKLNKAAAPMFAEKEWRPNGREGLPTLSLDSELDALKDF
jgi:hypothetical protein